MYLFGILNFKFFMNLFNLFFKFFSNGLEYLLLNDLIIEENVEIKIVL